MNSIGVQWFVTLTMKECGVRRSSSGDRQPQNIFSLSLFQMSRENLLEVVLLGTFSCRKSMKLPAKAGSSSGWGRNMDRVGLLALENKTKKAFSQ